MEEENQKNLLTHMQRTSLGDSYDELTEANCYSTSDETQWRETSNSNEVINFTHDHNSSSRSSYHSHTSNAEISTNLCGARQNDTHYFISDSSSQQQFSELQIDERRDTNISSAFVDATGPLNETWLSSSNNDLSNPQFIAVNPHDNSVNSESECAKMAPVLSAGNSMSFSPSSTECQFGNDFIFETVPLSDSDIAIEPVTVEIYEDEYTGHDELGGNSRTNGNNDEYACINLHPSFLSSSFSNLSNSLHMISLSNLASGLNADSASLESNSATISELNLSSEMPTSPSRSRHLNVPRMHVPRIYLPHNQEEATDARNGNMTSHRNRSQSGLRRSGRSRSRQSRNEQSRSRRSRSGTRSRRSWRSIYEHMFDVAHIMPESPVGLTPEEIELLHQEKFKGSITKDSSSRCIICLCEFKHDEVIRTLRSCNHIFHLTCIDEWLLNNPTCPLCRTDIKVLQ